MTKRIAILGQYVYFSSQNKPEIQIKLRVKKFIFLRALRQTAPINLPISSSIYSKYAFPSGSVGAIARTFSLKKFFRNSKIWNHPCEIEPWLYAPTLRERFVCW